MAVYYLLLLFIIKGVFSFTFEAYIIPEGEGNDPPTAIITAVANTTDIQLYCYVNRSDNVQRRSQWILIRKSGMETQLTFNSTTGISKEDDNYSVGGAYSTNFTILLFDNSLDNASIACGTGGSKLGIFNLFLIRKFLI